MALKQSKTKNEVAQSMQQVLQPAVIFNDRESFTQDEIDKTFSNPNHQTTYTGTFLVNRETDPYTMGSIAMDTFTASDKIMRDILSTASSEEIEKAIKKSPYDISVEFIEQSQEAASKIIATKLINAIRQIAYSVMQITAGYVLSIPDIEKDCPDAANIIRSMWQDKYVDIFGGYASMYSCDIYEMIKLWGAHVRGDRQFDSPADLAYVMYGNLHQQAMTILNKINQAFMDRVNLALSHPDLLCPSEEQVCDIIGATHDNYGDFTLIHSELTGKYKVIIAEENARFMDSVIDTVNENVVAAVNDIILAASTTYADADIKHPLTYKCYDL